MPTITITTTAVNPGDLITAELMNEILQRLKALEDAAVSVPDVVGLDLEKARLVLEKNLLYRGLVFNADSHIIEHGATLLDLAKQGVAPPTVQWQLPQAGMSVSPGSLVHLGTA